MTLEIFNALKQQAQKQRSESVKSRKHRLERLRQWLIKNENKIIEAAAKDFGKPAFEVLATEIFTVRSELKHNISELRKWMRPQRRKTPLSMIGHKSWVQFESKGVVLVIAPWNYPFFLVMSPLITALAAGNTVVVKPSEMTPHMSLALKDLVSDCFSPDEVYCALGDKSVTQKLLSFQFHHVFFTGSTQVGRIIAKACADKLIPVTLELGGKSPVIIDSTADLKDTAEKIHWGKFLNRGQTCVAPDFILIHQSIKNEFVKIFHEIQHSHKNETPTRIINQSHVERIKKLSNQHWDEKQNTLLLEIENLNHPAMAEEIFGPIIPLMSYSTESELLAHLDFDQRPLTLMIFSENTELIDRITAHFPSGSVTINTTTLQVGNGYLPFGGIGSSGMGTSHGFDGFKELSHMRSYMQHKYFKWMHEFVRPPYNSTKNRLLRVILDWTT